MNSLTYQRLLNQTLRLYEQEGSLQAYQFVAENVFEGEGNLAQIYNFRYALASASGNVETAMDILREAIVRHGFWYDPEYLLADDDLAPLRKYTEFQTFLKICKQRHADAKNASKPKLKVVDLDLMKDDTKPLLMAVHGDQENIPMTEAYWASVRQQGYMLALPQSSQVDFSDAFVWKDVDQGAREIESHFVELEKYKNVDTNNAIVGGFSAGCGVVLKAVLDDRISAKGLIFVAPWLPELENWESCFSILRKNEMRVHLICGNQDDDCFAGSNQFAEKLQSYGIPYRFEIVEGLDHEYPEHFHSMLKEAITFIQNEEMSTG